MILLNLAILLLLSCKKDMPPPPIQQYYTNFRRDGLEYLKVDAGKYLIYKDSATGGLDSVVVTVSILENLFFTGIYNSDVPGYHAQHLELRLNKFDAFTDSVWLYGDASAELSGPPYHSSDTADIVLNDQDNLIVFSFPTVSYPGNSLIPSLEIEGKTYTNVIKQITDNGLNISDLNYKKNIYYWAKQVGIIKREIITTNGNIRTYTLLRHN
jgi:hypothetical protein